MRVGRCNDDRVADMNTRAEERCRDGVALQNTSTSSNLRNNDARVLIREPRGVLTAGRRGAERGKQMHSWRGRPWLALAHSGDSQQSISLCLHAEVRETRQGAHGSLRWKIM